MMADFARYAIAAMLGAVVLGYLFFTRREE